MRFQVSGMTCGGYASAVINAVRKVAPDSEVDVDLSAGQVTVRGAR